MKSKIIIILTSLITMSCVLFLSNIVNADTTPWTQVGSTINGNYTSAQCNFANSGSINIVLGLANGAIGYWNGTEWKEIQPGSQVTSSGTNNGSSVTALYCDWTPINSNLSTYPDVIAGYANGDVQYLNSTTLKWDDLGIINPSPSQQVTKLGGVSVDSSNNLTACNVETATIPSDGSTPAYYTNKEVWTYNGTSWSNIVTNATATAIDSSTVGCATASYILYGDSSAFRMSNDFKNAATTNGDDYFFAGPATSPTNTYTYWGHGDPITVQGGWRMDMSHYPYISLNKNGSSDTNNNVSAVVADTALRYFTVENNVLVMQPDLWSDPNNTPFNGINVYWSNNYLVSFIAGLINGDLVWTLPNNTTPTVISAPPNFPSDYQDNHSITFASAQDGVAVEIFNNDGNCYIYAMSEPAIPSPVANPITLNVYVSGNLTTGTYDLAQATNVPNGLYSITETPSSNQIYIDDKGCEYALPYTLGTKGGPQTYTAEYQVIAPYGARASSTFTVVLDPSIIATNVNYGINTFHGTSGSVNIADYVNGCTDGSTYSVTFPCAWGTNIYGSTIQVSNITNKTNYTGSYTVQNQYGYTATGNIDVYGYFFVGP